MTLQHVMLALAAASWLAVGLSVFVVFERQRAARPGLWALRLAVVAADIAGCWATSTWPTSC